MSNVPAWVIVDTEAATKVGECIPVIHRTTTEQEAVEWLGNHPDQAKVARGGFGIDGPEENE